MSKFFARFIKDESGATAIEYGLIAALISVALIAGASTLGESLDNTFSAIAGKMEACVEGAATADCD
ncbi:Flp family type IVb pilin [Pseudorhizobium pelagicum]|uniref:Pilus assembly protein n=1 Tax=Pseudorhizobium pelagicum TaxID=1509405 RepID=A0A922NY20_9HYPH|nr:Flp family type IVb pilin [Pseudorhizobium pelagicum]KEQ03512.1 pilus assembly protein [Pseudorhizobium pelagicum]KEQ03855.1 pilus assembly protein [Pseudorhizobium pelagicum]